jgi:hypothetical protein
MRFRKSPAQLAAEAFEWLNITPEQVTAETRVSHWFPRLGGLDVVLGYLRAADGPEARKILELWSSTSTTYRRVLPFEAFCVAAGVQPAMMFAIAAVQICFEGGDAAKALAAITRGDAVDGWLERARTPGGWRERRMLAQQIGFVPAGKWVNVHACQNTWGLAVPTPIETVVRNMTDRFNAKPPTKRSARNRRAAGTGAN